VILFERSGPALFFHNGPEDLNATETISQYNYTQLFNINLATSELEVKGKTETAKTPEKLLEALRTVLIRAKSVLPLAPSPHRYAPGLAEVILYDTDGFVQAHCDCINGWSIVVSLGYSASFWYLDDNNNRKYITINSGDAVLLNSSPALNIQHGVDRVIGENFPSVISEMLSSLENSSEFNNKRIIVTVRQNICGANVLSLAPTEQ